MKARVLIAVQFALWAFFFTRLIPFSGDILLPIVWIHDKKVFAGYMVAHLFDIARTLPGVIPIVPFSSLKDLPSWFSILVVPLTLLFTASGLCFNVWIGGYFVRRKIRKLAPDLERMFSS